MQLGSRATYLRLCAVHIRARMIKKNLALYLNNCIKVSNMPLIIQRQKKEARRILQKGTRASPRRYFPLAFVHFLIQSDTVFVRYKDTAQGEGPFNPFVDLKEYLSLLNPPFVCSRRAHKSLSNENSRAGGTVL